jgi:hypothetical protein
MIPRDPRGHVRFILQIRTIQLAKFLASRYNSQKYIYSVGIMKNYRELWRIIPPTQKYSRMLATELEQQTEPCILSQSHSDFAQLGGAQFFPPATHFLLQQDDLQDLHYHVKRRLDVVRQ